MFKNGGRLTGITSTVCLHAEAAIRCLPTAVAAEVLAGAAVDEPLHLLHIGKNKGKKQKNSYLRPPTIILRPQEEE